MNSKTRKTLALLDAWPEPRSVKRTLREHHEDATAKYVIDPPPVVVDEFYECRWVIYSAERPKETMAQARRRMLRELQDE